MLCLIEIDEIGDAIDDYFQEEKSVALEPASKVAVMEPIEAPYVDKKEEAVSVPRTYEPVIEPEIEPLETYTYYDIPLSEELQDYIFKLCEERDIDPVTVMAIIGVESSYRASIMGDNGAAYGLMQIQPRWHQERINKLKCDNLIDPYQNILVGVDYFDELLDRGGSLEWALMAYNGGPSYANKKTAAGEISTYVECVYSRIDDLKSNIYIVRR